LDEREAVTRTRLNSIPTPVEKLVSRWRPGIGFEDQVDRDLVEDTTGGGLECFRKLGPFPSTVLACAEAPERG